MLTKAIASARSSTLCCQAIGQIKEVESCRNVVGLLLDEYVDAVKKGTMLLEA
jgi:hypothetical protein